MTEESLDPAGVERLVKSLQEMSAEDHIDLAACHYLGDSNLVGTLACLPYPDQQILSLCHGLQDGRARKPVEVAGELGVSAENVVTIESNARRRLLTLARQEVQSLSGIITPYEPVEALGLSTRPERSLKKEGIKTVGQLCEMTESRIERIPGIGDKSLDEIVMTLDEFDLALKEE